MKAKLIWLFLLMAIYLSNLRLIAAGDSLPTALTALSLVTDHSLAMDRMGPWTRSHIPWSDGLILWLDGHYYSVYPIGLALMTAPMIAPFAYLDGVRDWHPADQLYFARWMEKLAAAFWTALAGVVMLSIMRRLVPGFWAWSLSAIFALGTMAWPIASQALWQQTGGLFLLATALYLYLRWLEHPMNPAWLLALGAACALGILVRPFNAIWTAAFAVPVVLWHRQGRALLSLALFPVLGVIASAAYNWHIFRNLLGGYGQFISATAAHPLAALAGILWSPGRGLFFFSPVMLLALAAPFRRVAWSVEKRALMLACLLLIAGQVALTSAWSVWWGGWSWGWRLLTELSAPLVVLMAIAIPAIRWKPAGKALFAMAAVLSIWIQAVGVYCYPRGGWDAAPYPVDQTRVWNWRDNPVARSVNAGMELAPYRAIGRMFAPRVSMPREETPPDLLVK